MSAFVPANRPEDASAGSVVFSRDGSCEGHKPEPKRRVVHTLKRLVLFAV